MLLCTSSKCTVQCIYWGFNKYYLFIIVCMMMALFFFVCLLSVDGAQNSGEPGTAISNRTYHNVHSTAMCGKSQHVIRLLSWHTLLLYVDNAAISKSNINAPGVKPLLEGDIVSALLTYTLCRLYCEGEQLVEHPLTEKSKDWKLLAEQRLHSNRCRHCSGILTKKVHRKRK